MVCPSEMVFQNENKFSISLNFNFDSHLFKWNVSKKPFIFSHPNMKQFSNNSFPESESINLKL